MNPLYKVALLAICLCTTLLLFTVQSINLEAQEISTKKTEANTLLAEGRKAFYKSDYEEAFSKLEVC